MIFLKSDFRFYDVKLSIPNLGNVLNCHCWKYMIANILEGTEMHAQNILLYIYKTLLGDTTDFQTKQPSQVFRVVTCE
jgi:hypothetical protein